MKNTLHIIIFIFLTIGLVSCKKTQELHKANHSQSNDDGEVLKLGHENNDIMVTKSQFESAKMELSTLIEQSFPEIVKTTGMIDVPPQSKALITSYYAGNVKKSDLLIGDKVRKGQPLVSISNPVFVEIQQEYLEVSEQLNFLKTEYERQKTLFDEKITSQKNYIKAKTVYNQNMAKYNGFRKKLQMLNINPTAVERGEITSIITLYAPISGSVTKVNVSIGTHISPQDVMMEIVNTDHIHVELTVFEKDILQVKKDQKIRFKISEASQKIYEAEVHLVGTTIDENTRTVKVHGHFNDDENHTFVVGMFVDAEIETVSNKVFAIPETAVIEDDGHTAILRLEKKEDNTYHFKSVEIEIGKTYKGFVEVISKKIKPVDKILIKGAYALSGGEGGGHSH